MSTVRWYELGCLRCDWRETVDAVRIHKLLTAAKLARPHIPPDPELLPELLKAGLRKFPCPKCGKVGMREGEAVGGPAIDVDAPVARRCVECGASISLERLAARPDADLCVACQEAQDG